MEHKQDIEIENDLFVRMPPVKSWKARVRITSVKNARMQIVEPD